MAAGVKQKVRNMSFALTKPQLIMRVKTVTRRDGWASAEPGDLIRPVDKVMGFKKGDHPKPLLPPNVLLEIVSVRRERLTEITAEDVVREGFPDMTPDEFIAMYRRHGDKAYDKKVSRIEFRYVEVKQG